MQERRAAPRIVLEQGGKIAVDEHTTVGCIVFDRSDIGVRVVLPDADLVPDPFVLMIDGTADRLICQVAWRADEEIGARVGVPHSTRPRLRRQAASP